MSAKKDMTRIEDLSEFIHSQEEESDIEFDQLAEDNSSNEETPPLPDDGPSLVDSSEESFEESFEEDSFDSLEEGGDQPSFESQNDDNESDFSSEENSADWGEDQSSNEGDFSSDNNDESEEVEEGLSFNDDEENNPETDFSSEESFNLSDDSSNESEENDFTSNDADFASDDDDFSSLADEQVDQSFEDTTNDELSSDHGHSDETSEEDDLTFAEDHSEESDNTQDIEESEVNEKDLNQKIVGNLQEQASETKEDKRQREKVQQKPEAVFNEIKKDVESISFGKATQGGNPPFAILVSDIVFKEDKKTIQDKLDELGLYQESFKKEIDLQIERGELLISQISEYIAIHLIHSFRNLNCHLKMGLSEEIHPSKNYRPEHRGILTKKNLLKNKKRYQDFDTIPSIENLLVTTESRPFGYEIIEYIDVLIAQQKIQSTSQSHLSHEGLLENQFYQDLIGNMKKEARSKGGNALIDLNINLRPLTASDETGEVSEDGLPFILIVSGSIVVLKDQHNRNEADNQS